MRILDFLQYSISPWVRILACLILGSALYFLYRWDPERSQQEEEDNRPYGEYSLEPPDDETGWEAFSGDGSSDSVTPENRNTSVIELERYLNSLKHHRIQSLDKV